MRPKRLANGQKKQRRYYSGKKKAHTLKGQVVIDLASLQVLDIAFDSGRVHDIEVSRRRPPLLAQAASCLADKGYQGLDKEHPQVVTPFKAPKGGTLTPEQRQFNRLLSHYRIRVEHVIRSLKIFRILAGRYRNRRRRYGLRLSLIAGLYNHQLIHA